MNFLGDQTCQFFVLLWLPHHMPYCDTCSRSHEANNKALCAKYQENQANSTRVIRAVAKMPKAPSHESSPDLSSRFFAMSLEERELKPWKEIEAMELEECIAELEAKRDRYDAAGMMKVRKKEGRTFLLPAGSTNSAICV